jgi:hypothetical protein
MTIFPGCCSENFSTDARVDVTTVAGRGTSLKLASQALLRVVQMPWGSLSTVTPVDFAMLAS